jgi:glycosyltransferase involved in cell wall biosynthesis
MSVAVCMIVRNGAQTIERAIMSVRPFVDELCVLLVGESEDETAAILDRLGNERGAQIHVDSMPWPGSFSVAREASFARASSEWLMWLDDDEILEGGGHLREALAGDALFVRRIDELNPDSLVLRWEVRLVRSEAGIHWRGVVHEYLELDDDADAHIVPPDLVRVRHRGKPVEGRHRYRELVEAEYAAGDTRFALYVANTKAALGDLVAAADVLERFVAEVEASGSVYDVRYLAALERLAVIRATQARALHARRTELRARWIAEADSGLLTGPKRLFAEFVRLDARDAPDRSMWRETIAPPAEL